VQLVLALATVFFSSSYDAGRLSFYWPGDGHNNGLLACGGRFSSDQVHIAYRGWRRVGCRRLVLVCADSSGKCALARVMDAGPFGIYKGRLKGCAAEGRRRVWTKSLTPPAGWKWRGQADLSVALWKKLGKPRFLTKVRLYFLPRGEADEEIAAAVRDAAWKLQRLVHPTL